MAHTNTRFPVSQITGSVLVLLALAGCQPTLQDGRFTCGPTIDCPTGFTCRSPEMRCYRAGDGGVMADAEVEPDTAAIDASADAGRDGCGPNCVQLIVLNADPDAIGSIDYYDTGGAPRSIPIPAYGTTSATIDVPNVRVPGTLQINVPPTATIFHSLEIVEEGRYLLVLGPASVGASVRLLRQAPAGLHTAGYVYVQLVDMTADSSGVGFVATGAGRTATDRMDPNPFGREAISDTLPILPGSANALRLAFDPTSPQLVAALLADRIPATEGTYFVVVGGRVNAHLDTDDGLVFIPGLPSSAALRSSRLVRFINTVGNTATVCEGATLLTTLPDGVLSPPLVPTTSEPWPLTVHIGTDCVTGSTYDVTVGPAVGRTLVSIAGDHTAAWQAVSISEPRPPGGGNSTIVIHNALPAPSTIAGVAGIPSLGTASTTVVSLPATITATTTAGSQTFPWLPMERQSWVVVTDGTAFEIDSPFRTPWIRSEVSAE